MAGAGQLPSVSTDTVWVDSIATHSGQKAVLDITFSNTDSLNAIDLPLKLSDPAIIIDSVSFVGSRIENKQLTIVTIDSTLGTCKIGSINFGLEYSAIEPGRGLFSRMYVDIPDAYLDRVVVVDTTVIITPLTFTRVGDSSIHPEFRRGYIDNSYSPASPDSIWVADAAADAGDRFSVTVSGYNSYPLYHINLPLVYLSDNIDFDSMTLTGTRTENALVSNVMFDNDIKKLLVSIGFTDGTLLPVGSGPLAVLHFTVRPSGTTATAIIDTTGDYLSDYYFQLGQFYNYVKIYPAFTPGTVTIDLGTAVDEDMSAGLPTEFSLEQNVPNPFNPTTSIAFTLPERSQVRLEVYNILGQRVRTLVNDVLPPGSHSVIFDGADGNGQPLATGVYLYVIKTEDFTQSRKMLLMK